MGLSVYYATMTNAHNIHGDRRIIHLVEDAIVSLAYAAYGTASELDRVSRVRIEAELVNFC